MKHSKFKAHANNVALPHTIFSLPFALASSFMATNGHPDFWTVILILLAITSARADETWKLLSDGDFEKQ